MRMDLYLHTYVQIYQNYVIVSNYVGKFIHIYLFFVSNICIYIYVLRSVYIPYTSSSWLDFKTSVGQILSSKHLWLVSAKTIKGTQSTENDLVNCSQTVFFLHEVTSFKGLRIERTSRCSQMHLKL